MAKGDILEELSITDSSGGTTDTTSAVFTEVPNEGDLLVFLIATPAASVDTAPTEATEILSRTMSNTFVKGYYIIADGIEDTFSFSFTGNSNSGLKALRFEGPYVAGDMDVLPDANGQLHESTTTVTILSTPQTVTEDVLALAVLWYPFPSVSTTPISWSNSFTGLADVGPNNGFIRTAIKEYSTGASDVQTVATMAGGNSWGYSWILTIPRDASVPELTYSFGGINAGLIL